MHYVYIIFSRSLSKFYAGETSDLEIRLKGHNSNKNRFTGKVNDWVLVWKTEFPARTEALKFERKIKKRGIKRFLEDIDFKF